MKDDKVKNRNLSVGRSETVEESERGAGGQRRIIRRRGMVKHCATHDFAAAAHAS